MNPANLIPGSIEYLASSFAASTASRTITRAAAEKTTAMYNSPRFWWFNRTLLTLPILLGSAFFGDTLPQFQVWDFKMGMATMLYAGVLGGVTYYMAKHTSQLEKISTFQQKILDFSLPIKGPRSHLQCKSLFAF